MKIKVNADHVRRAAALLRKALPAAPGQEIFTQIGFNIAAAGIYLDAGSSTCRAQVCIPGVPEGDMDPACVAGRRLLTVLRQCRGEQAELMFAGKCQVRSGNYRATLPYDLEPYPEAGSSGEPQIADLPETFLADAVRLFPSISKSDRHPSLRGIIVDRSEGRTDLYAADGITLDQIYDYGLEQIEDGRLILPDQLLGLLPDEAQDLKLLIYENHVGMTLSAGGLALRLLSAKIAAGPQPLAQIAECFRSKEPAVVYQADAGEISAALAAVTAGLGRGAKDVLSDVASGQVVLRGTRDGLVFETVDHNRSSARMTVDAEVTGSGDVRAVLTLGIKDFFKTCSGQVQLEFMNETDPVRIVQAAVPRTRVTLIQHQGLVIGAT